MSLRIGLRWRILFLTILPPVAVALATVWIMQHGASRQLATALRESLHGSSLVLETVLAARFDALAATGQIVARDPRLGTALLTNSGGEDEVRPALRDLARELNAYPRTELLEVFDRRGRLLGRAGGESSSRAGRAALLAQALRGRTATGLLVEGDRHYLAATTPVVVHGEVVGVLMLGSRLGGALAQQLRVMTRSEVSFAAPGALVATSLGHEAPRLALLEQLRELQGGAGDSLTQYALLELKSPGQRQITLIRPLPRAPSDARVFYVLQRSLDPEAEFLLAVKNGVLQVGLLAALVALLGGILIADRITGPIQQLVRGADEMKRGDYAYPLDITGHDEIANLAERFEEMRQREQAYIRSLQEVARLKSDFIHVASHELRTPISVIRGVHDLFAAGDLGPLTPTAQKALAAVESSLRSLTRIAEDATKMAQIEGERLVLDLQDQDVASVVRQGVEDAIADAQKRELDLVIEVEPDLPPARMDPMRLAQAVSNVVRNAIRFTPDGGRIEVAAWREAAELIVRVNDTGIGIEPDRLAGLLDGSVMVRDTLHHHSSSTLEFRSAGLGLGLAIVRGIVEAHGGRMEVASEVARGTVLTLRIPYRGTQGERRAA